MLRSRIPELPGFMPLPCLHQRVVVDPGRFTLRSRIEPYGECLVNYGQGMREVWTDLARGIAVVSMFVAHVAPGGGAIMLSEFLTAPLFALLVTVSLVFSWERRRVGPLRWYAIQVLRGVTLVVLGELLQHVYDQILVVLQALGVLTIIAAALVPFLAARHWISLAGALIGAGVSPLIMNAGRMLTPQSPSQWWLLDILATGYAYRIATFLPFGLLGISLLGLIRSLRTPRAAVLTASAIAVVATTVAVVDQTTVKHLRPYSGTTREILFTMTLTAMTVLGCVAITRVLGPGQADSLFAPVTSTGRLALTAYTLQFVLLAVIVQVFLDGGRDDSFIVLGVLTGTIFGFCWFWDRVGWVRPVESLLRLPQRWLAAAAPVNPRDRPLSTRV